MRNVSQMMKRARRAKKKDRFLFSNIVFFAFNRTSIPSSPLFNSVAFSNYFFVLLVQLVLSYALSLSLSLACSTSAVSPHEAGEGRKRQVVVRVRGLRVGERATAALRPALHPISEYFFISVDWCSELRMEWQCLWYCQWCYISRLSQYQIWLGIGKTTVQLKKSFSYYTSH